MPPTARTLHHVPYWAARRVDSRSERARAFRVGRDPRLVAVDSEVAEPGAGGGAHLAQRSQTREGHDTSGAYRAAGRSPWAE